MILIELLRNIDGEIEIVDNHECIYSGDVNLQAFSSGDLLDACYRDVKEIKPMSECGTPYIHITLREKV